LLSRDRYKTCREERHSSPLARGFYTHRLNLNPYVSISSFLLTDIPCEGIHDLFSSPLISKHMKYLLSLLLIWSQLFAQDPVVSGEWFFDGPDPGYGLATPFAAFSPDTLISANDQFSLNTLSPGVHQWSVRVKDDQGVWSHTYTRSFLLLAWDPEVSLKGGEWFWDHDPGFGQGQPLALSGTSDSISWTIELDTLPPGIHYLYVRVQDANKIWSHTYRRSTYIRAHPDAPIDRLSYFFVGPDSTSSTFTYFLSQPQHYVDISFDPDAGDWVDSTMYEICVTAIRTDSIESCARCASFLYRVEDSTGGVSAPSLEAATLALFPNPNRGQFSIEFPYVPQGETHIKLFDGQGREVHSQDHAGLSRKEIGVKVENLPEGVYFVVVETGVSVWVKRMLIE